MKIKIKINLRVPFLIPLFVPTKRKENMKTILINTAAYSLSALAGVGFILAIINSL